MGQPMDGRVVEALGLAYYARAAAVADQARARAQSGFAIASFLAGGIVGAGLLTGAATLPVAVRITAAVAIVLWVITALLYARAVGEPVRLQEEDQPDAESFVRKVLDNARDERNEVDRKRHLAYLVSIAAAAATALAAVLGLLTRAEEKHATILLTPAGIAAVEALCGSGATELDGIVKVADIGREYLTVRPRDPACADHDLHIRRADVLQIATPR